MTIIYFILILGTVVLIHELGHFMFAKLFNVYVYEFSIGMGKKLFSYKKKGGETEYSLRLIPIGGFVSLAGEEVDDDTKIGENRKIWSKKAWQRFLIMGAGAFFNFLLAIVILFFIGLICGSISSKPIVGEMVKDYPAIEAGMVEGDRIISINDKKISTWDDVIWELQMANGKETVFIVVDKFNNEKILKVTPKKEIVDDQTQYKYGISKDNIKEYGFISAIKYTFQKTGSLFKIMFNTISSLFTGNVSVNDLSGPVGIYTVVDSQAKDGFASIVYLVAFLSINVGFINLLPFPAFDGGRILFLLIEKIKGSPVSPKIENMIHSIGFVLLIGLMIYVTFNDIIKLF